MSASEKLRELEKGQFRIVTALVREGKQERVYADGEKIVSLVKALPQLIAVVEAAESIDEDRRNMLMTPLSTEDRINDALTALSEALERK